MFRIKICGVTTIEDAQAASAAGADAIGLNFYPASPRAVDMGHAAEIVRSLPAGVIAVGVFVNATPDEVRETVHAVGLGMIQLHGDESPTVLQQVAIRPVVRAFRCRDSGLRPAVEHLRRCRAAGVMPHAVLLDAYDPEKYGGTGQCLDWSALRSAGGALDDLPVVLAGGLTPENVAAAIEAARPAAVDTAGGVESSPGRKNADKLQRYVTAAREAFDRLASREGGTR